MISGTLTRDESHHEVGEEPTAQDTARQVNEDVLIYLLRGRHPNPVVNAQIEKAAAEAAAQDGPIKRALALANQLERDAARVRAATRAAEAGDQPGISSGAYVTD